MNYLSFTSFGGWKQKLLNNIEVKDRNQSIREKNRDREEERSRRAI